ncbi:MAG: hypothetical protein PHD48_07295 [Alphaproteobacteria bacterium]|nr:hypothetical protein [Alphaproteobacteria bacterium]
MDRKPLKDRILDDEWARDVKERSETEEEWGCLTKKITLMLHPEVYHRLRKLSEATGHSHTNLAKQAIRDFLKEHKEIIDDMEGKL